MSHLSAQPFHLSIPDHVIADLKSRLKATRWASPELEPEWNEGPPLAAMKELCDYWQYNYDWKKCQAWFNSYPQYIAEIDGMDIHFLHIKSKHNDALPMLLVHGWPGSVLEFRKIIEALINDPEQPFDLIIPSLPGYGWSSKPSSPGWGLERMARAFISLLNDVLACPKWIAQGGDWGADIAALIGYMKPAGLIGIHMNTTYFDVRKEIGDRTPQTEGESLALKKHHEFETDEYGYFLLQKTRPQTIAYALADSPVAQASWIYEKIHAWCDDPSVLTKDEVLDNIMLYWLSNSGGSSARLYKEDDTTALKIDVPVGVSIFPGDHYYAPREWGKRYYSNIVHWRDMEKGGHFAAWEVPELFVKEMQDAFKHVR